MATRETLRRIASVLVALVPIALLVLAGACDTRIDSTIATDLGASRIVAASEANVTAVGASATEIFWADANGAVWACAKGGDCASPRRVVTLPGALIQTIVVREGYLVFESSTSLYACPTSGCATATFLGGTVNGSAFDGRAVYTTENDAILRCAVDACTSRDRVLRELSCRSKDDCPSEAPICEEATHACLPCPRAELATCAGCNGDFGSTATARCPSSKGTCDGATKRCRSCTDADCAAPSFCSTAGSCATSQVLGNCPPGTYYNAANASRIECLYQRRSGEGCASNQECDSGSCASGVCGLPNGAKCKAASECASAVCDDFGYCAAPPRGIDYASRFAVMDGRVYFVRAGLFSCGIGERCTPTTATKHRSRVPLVILGAEPGALYFAEADGAVKRCAPSQCAEGQEVRMGQLRGTPSTRPMLFTAKHVYVSLVGGAVTRCARAGCDAFSEVTRSAPNEPGSRLGEVPFAVEGDRIYWATRTIFGRRGQLVVDSPED